MTKEETLKINQEEAKSPSKRVDGTVLSVLGFLIALKGVSMGVFPQ